MIQIILEAENHPHLTIILDKKLSISVLIAINKGDVYNTLESNAKPTSVSIFAS